MPSAADIREYAHEQQQRLRENLRQAVSNGQVEAVHQVRVASRRLEEPLELCRPWVSGKQVDRATRRLKAIRKAFQRVRDLDVLKLSFSATQDENLPPADLEELNRHFAVERVRLLSRAKKKAGASEYDEVAGIVSQVLDDFEHSGGSQPDWIAARLTGLVTERAQVVLENAPVVGTAVDLHPTRLNLKRLRYALELKMAITGQRDKDVMKEFKAMQDRLGDWNDQLQAARYLSKIARSRRVIMDNPAWAATLLTHAAWRLGHGRELVDAFLAEWPAFSKVIAEMAASEDSTCR